jgi:hypothetical protein
MPVWAQWAGEVFPTTHAIRIVRGLLLKGTGLPEILPELWPIALFTLVVVMVAIRFYRETSRNLFSLDPAFQLPRVTGRALEPCCQCKVYYVRHRKAGRRMTRRVPRPGSYLRQFPRQPRRRLHHRLGGREERDRDAISNRGLRSHRQLPDRRARLARRLDRLAALAAAIRLCRVLCRPLRDT